jgi:microcystin-dependent protein
MAQPYVGEIRMFGGNFAPAGWAFCEGQLLAIAGNDVLFQLIGTTYGGDGQSTFALPNLQSRIPIHQGTGGGDTYTIGQSSGVETVTLATNQMPIHNHPMLGSLSNGTNVPSNGVLAQPTTLDIYRPGTTPSSPLDPNSITSAGGSQPHDNTQPFLCVNFIISLFGIFPSQT